MSFPRHHDIFGIIKEDKRRTEVIEKLKGNQTYTDDLRSGLIRDKLNELIEAVNLMMTESESRQVRAKKLAEEWEREDRYR